MIYIRMRENFSRFVFEKSLGASSLPILPKRQNRGCDLMAKRHDQLRVPTARPALTGAVFSDDEFDGQAWRRILRKVRHRRLLPNTRWLGTHFIKTAEFYAATCEAVQTGGGSSKSTEKVDGGRVIGERRQSSVIDAARRLQSMSRVIGNGSVLLDGRGTTASVIGMAIATTLYDAPL